MDCARRSYSQQLREYVPSTSGRTPEVVEAMKKVRPYGIWVGLLGYMGIGKSSFGRALAYAAGNDAEARDIVIGDRPNSLTQAATNFGVSSADAAVFTDLAGFSDTHWMCLEADTLKDLADAAAGTPEKSKENLQLRFRMDLCARLEAFTKGYMHIGDGKPTGFDWTDPVPAADAVPDPTDRLRNSLSGFLVFCPLKTLGKYLWVDKVDGVPHLVLNEADGSPNDLARALTRTRKLREHSSVASKCQSVVVFTGLDVLIKHASCARGQLGETLAKPEENVETLKRLLLEAVGVSHADFIDTSDPENPETQEQAAKIFLQSLRNCERGVEALAREELARAEVPAPVV